MRVRISMTATECELPEGDIHMPNPYIPWPPSIGDRVGIKGTRLLGIVERIEGQAPTQQFVLTIFAPAIADIDAAKDARTTYALDELEPHS
jgi:hypothetical protein